MIKKNINNLFIYFLAAHTFVWTVTPSISNQNLPLDTIEHLAWASNLDWGFEKHPPFVAFILNIFYQIFGNQDWGYYLVSQIFVIFSFYVVWKFSEYFFNDKKYCLISVLLLEAIYFYNFTTPEFNVNICLLPFWALTVLYFWKGIKENKTSDWLLFGLFTALGILSKYTFIYLIGAKALYLLYLISKKKINFKFLISILPFGILIFPHLIWLIENNFVTFSYGLSRTGLGDPNFFNHLKHPLVFIGKQIGILIPFFILLFAIVSNFKIKLLINDKRLFFLLVINLVPLLLVFLTSMIMGVKIRTMWMTPFYLFYGVLFVYLLKNNIKFKKLKKFSVTFLVLFILSPIVYLYISISETNKRTDYPGKEIARLVQQRWDKNFLNEISIVVGDEWFGGNLSYHLNSRPKWFRNLDNVKDIDLKGGVIYVGNPKVLKQICPGIFGTIKPTGICMIGSK